MGIISKLKSVLRGANERPARPGDGNGSLADDDEPEAAGERAVKGGHASQPRRDEPGSRSEERSGSRPEDEPGSEAEAAPDDEAEPVDSIKGIGPAYARRLEAAGVHSVADLAAADPDDVAAATDLGTGRVGNWIDRARARTGKRDG